MVENSHFDSRDEAEFMQRCQALFDAMDFGVRLGLGLVPRPPYRGWPRDQSAQTGRTYAEKFEGEDPEQ